MTVKKKQQTTSQAQTEIAVQKQRGVTEYPRVVGVCWVRVCNFRVHAM